MFILCSEVNITNFDKTLLLAILSNFKLTSLAVHDGNEDILITLLQIASIQETLEHFNIKRLNIFECTSVVDLLVEFKRIKTVRINWYYFDDDTLEQLKLEIGQFKRKLRKKHSQIYIDIGYSRKYS